MRRHVGDAHAFVTDVTAAYGAAQRAGPALARRPAVADVDRPLERGVPVPHGARTSTSASPACCASASPTSASSATSSTCRPSRPSTCTTESSSAGEEFGLRHAGLKALASLRMEKGYRDYGHDIDNTDGPLEAGLGFALALDKPHGFVGRDAIVARKSAGPPARRLVQVLVLDPQPLLHHAGDRAARRGRRRLRARRLLRAHPGWRSRAGDGAGRGRAPSRRSDWLSGAEWSVEIAGRQYPAAVSLRPLYDPDNSRIKA